MKENAREPQSVVNAMPIAVSGTTRPDRVVMTESNVRPVLPAYVA